ncbi:hypothetical protein Halru_2456 [Halovivax ruber XH-70]|uniref:Uncharacterized protein n=1 Tax=Halovivax ruber (strain DSM 18193 / JCM 13892 / XH-70) TaxID=797302 RepID=L0IDX6_HALRX|nr:hypothetical protein [Halovivax ruber]AGB17038.1 hypothetical protein Halru_2456 [Halovivax ruber XH-70]
MTTWADLFERAATVAADRETIRETLDRQRSDASASAADGTEETDG